VFTDTQFANGRGVSIITTLEQADLFSQSPAFTNIVTASQQTTPSRAFEVKEIPSHGMGAIANQTIFRGDRLMDYGPVLFIHDAVWEHFVEEDYLPLLHTAIERLPLETRDVFLNLAGQGKGDQIDDILDTNSFNVNLFGDNGFGPTSYSILIPEVARLNHDCRPNAAYHFNANTLTQTVLALRSIPPGEELSISYVPQLQPRTERQALLHKSWGFHCDCSLCSAPTSLAVASDSRIQRANVLKAELLDYTSLSKASPGMAELLISLYEQERLWGPTYEAYQLATTELNGVGDVSRAEKYGRLALEAALVYRGPDHVDVKALEVFLENPKEHWSWLLRIRMGSVK
jgi:SET domain